MKVQVLQEGELAVCCSLKFNKCYKQIRFRFNDGPIDPGGNALLAISLLPAMLEGKDLRIEAPVSARLLEASSLMQNIFKTWDSKFQNINIIPQSLDETNSGSEKGTALFFTAGLDSFYSLIKNKAKIESLIYVNGYDIPLENTELFKKVMIKLESVASKLNKRLLVVESDIRPLYDSYHDWILLHGAALAGVAHFLSPLIKKVFIAASNSYLQLVAAGTHPVLDHLWSTESLEFVHDGAEATRLQKMTYIINENPELVLDNLRVCWLNYENEYNCGRCRKCLQAMLNLRVLGVLDHSKTFPRSLDLAEIAGMTLTNPLARSNMAENLLLVEQKGKDPALANAIRTCLIQETPITAKHEAVSHLAEILELRAQLEYYRSALRFQLADRLKSSLQKNKASYYLAEILAQKIWNKINNSTSL